MPSSARRYRPLLLCAGLAIVGGCLQHGLEPAQDQQVERVEPIKEPFGEAALGIDVERPDNGAEDCSDLVYTAYGTFQAYKGGYEIDFSGPEKSVSCCLFQVAEDRFCVEVFGLSS